MRACNCIHSLAAVQRMPIPAMVPTVVVSTWTWHDWLGAVLVRLNIGRQRYALEPGLYAIGQPGVEAPVFVTANYKLSFDILRHALNGIAGWLLVLDTKGINVWCAAAKGTFGTDELVRSVTATGLKQVVTHRTLIIPQLGAPGIAAHEVQRQCGFRVVYGPVRAKDIPVFLADGMHAASAMRRITFTMPERLMVVPVELMIWAKYALLLVAALALLAGFTGGHYEIGLTVTRGLPLAGTVLLGCIVGGIITPILLPWLPGRAFSFKGAITGIGLALVCWLFGAVHTWVYFVAVLLILGSTSSFMGLQFTGASTFTSLSGVRKETRIALPLQGFALLAGIIMWFIR